MSGKREERADEEQLLRGSAAPKRNPVARQPGERRAYCRRFLLHPEVTGLWCLKN